MYVCVCVVCLCETLCLPPCISVCCVCVCVCVCVSSHRKGEKTVAEMSHRRNCRRPYNMISMDIHFRWTLDFGELSTRTNMTLDVKNFDLEQQPNCTYDFMALYKGTDNSTQIGENYCGFAIPSKYVPFHQRLYFYTGP